MKTRKRFDKCISCGHGRAYGYHDVSDGSKAHPYNPAMSPEEFASRFEQAVQLLERVLDRSDDEVCAQLKRDVDYFLSLAYEHVKFGRVEERD